MQQLVKSAGSLSWALPLFGLQQMADALRRSEDGTLGGDAIAAFDAITRASIDQCGASVRETFEVGDRMQRDLVDTVFRLVPLGGSERSTLEPCMPGTAGLPDLMNPMQMMRRFTGRSDHAPQPQSHAQQPDESELGWGWGPVPPIN